MAASLAEHGYAGLRRGSRFRHFQGGLNEPGDVIRSPLELAVRVGPRLTYSTELGQQCMATPRPEQPGKTLRLFGVRLQIVLKYGDREHAVDEVLCSASCLHSSRIRVLTGSSKDVV